MAEQGIMQFKDRLVEEPGRVQLTDCETQETRYYVLTPAEGAVREEGTPFNADSFNAWTDSVADYLTGASRAQVDAAKAELAETLGADMTEEVDAYAAEVRADIDAALAAVSDKTAELTEGMARLTENVRGRLEEIQDVTTDKRGSDVRYADGSGIPVVYLTEPPSATEAPAVAASKTYVDKHSSYDVIIRTQEEFEALLASPDWLGVKSAAFKGTFVKNGDGITVPAGVRTIAGLDGAVICVNDYAGEPLQGAFGYAAPASVGTSVRDLTVKVNGAPHKLNVFRYCRDLRNCRAILCRAAGGSAGYGECEGLYGCTAETEENEGYNAVGFQNCRVLERCKVRIAGEACDGYRDSEELYACESRITSNNTANGFNRCKKVRRCVSEAKGRNAAAYRECTHVENSLAAAEAAGVPYSGAAYETDPSCYAWGYRACTDVYGCRSEAHTTVAPDGARTNFRNGTAGGFDGCEDVEECVAVSRAETQYGAMTEYGGSNKSYGYSGCNRVRSSRADVVSRVERKTMPELNNCAHNYAYGFYNCEGLWNTRADVTAVTPDFTQARQTDAGHSVTAYGYYRCTDVRLSDATVVSDKPAGSGNAKRIFAAAGVPTEAEALCRGTAAVLNGVNRA